jgi:hypothetical protein
MKRKLHVRVTPEYLRSRARRDAPYIKLCGWRPTKKDIKELKAKHTRRDCLSHDGARVALRRLPADGDQANRRTHLKTARAHSPPTRARTFIGGNDDTQTHGDKNA